MYVCVCVCVCKRLHPTLIWYAFSFLIKCKLSLNPFAFPLSSLLSIQHREVLLVRVLQLLLGDPLDAVKDAVLVTSLFLFNLSFSAGVPLSGALSATPCPE